MIPNDIDWKGDWLKNQQHYWQSWANMAGQPGLNTSNPFSPNMASNPFSPDWSQTLDQWWRLVSPKASDPVADMFQRVVDAGKNFNKLAEQGYNFGQTQDQEDLIQNWLNNIQEGFDAWSKQITANKSSSFLANNPLFADSESLIPEWMGLNKGSLEFWDSLASNAGLGVPDIPGLDKGKVEFSRLLKSPALGQWREHQQQLQTIAQRVIEFQDADQVYKLAFAQMGLRSVEALRNKLTNLKDDEKFSTVREFYDLWVNVNEEVYGEFAMTDEYQVTHGDFVNSLMALRKETNAFTEKLYKAANLPTRSEINTINKRLQEQRRENIDLKAKIKKLDEMVDDIRNNEVKTSPVEQAKPVQHKDLSAIKGVGPKIVEKLKAQGIESLEQIAKMQTEELKKLDKQIGGNGKALRDGWIAQANNFVKS